ncbi:complement C1q and tumor necrosis factor-related protein 9-like [Sceloporus undulatus]|uniref:complement C1q and tumor necrosis factor-related protein 9-like n=1 Tax=Sceloporus undulatus TaxID=8520 RepID=UPI001C4D9E76|nr:complement C1q and tumor necrosis factor-related protein 9-like [Sceloporus undulatus]
MPSLLLIHALLSSIIWGPVRMTAIFSFAPDQLFTVESLSGATETVDPEQASTVPPDQAPKTNEIDPVTDGGSQASSQIVVTSPATFYFNAADGVENKNLPEATATTTIASKQQITSELFITATPVPMYSGIGSSGDENSSSSFTQFADANKSLAIDDRVAPAISNAPKENNTDTERHHFCKIPGAEGQKRDQGEKKNAGVSKHARMEGEIHFLVDTGREITAERGDSRSNAGQTEALGGFNNSCPKGDRGDTGNPGPMGLPGPKGDKGDYGESGPKGENGLKGDSGEKGERGLPGKKGDKGLLGIQGAPGIKGDQGTQGRVGPPGQQGPIGFPGQKGQKGQKGDCRAVEPTAFSVALQKRRSFPLPGSPVTFENVFLNENEAYHDETGIFTANAGGVYFFSYHLSVSRKSLRAGLFHNGQRILQMSSVRQPPQNVGQVSGSVLVHLSEDDEIWLEILNGSQNGLVADETTDSVFSGFLLYPD